MQRNKPDAPRPRSGPTDPVNIGYLTLPACRAFKLSTFDHKLKPPTVLNGAVIRSHLLDAVLATPSHRVVFIQAPAGHGKTTLLQQFLSRVQALGVGTGWLTLDESDDDPTRFLEQFGGLIESAQASRANTAISAAFAPTADQNLGAVHEALHALGRDPRPIALFIDEFQVVQSKVILSFFSRLLSRLPSHVTVLFGSRRLPEIGLGRLQMRSVAILFKTSDLRFTRSEAATFFSGSLDGTTDKQLVDELYARTEGWPAALQLTRLALRGGVRKRVADLLGFSTTPEFEEYFADDVLSAQTAETRDFLLETSVLERFTAELCAHLTGKANAESIIVELERVGLFIMPLSSERHWFRYHSLFSAYLRKQLRGRQTEAPTRLHQRAAAWFFSHGYPEDAMHHAVSAGDFGRGAAILEDWSDQLIREGRLSTIERWLDVLPVEHVRTHPGLQMKVLWALLFLRRFHRARPVLDALSGEIERNQGVFTRPATLPLLIAVRHLMEDDIVSAGKAVFEIDVERDTSDHFESFELGAIANIQSLFLRTRGEFLAAQGKAVIGIAHSEAGHAAFSGAYAMAFLGNAYLAQGRARDALRAYRQGFETASTLRGSYASAVIAACYGEALYLTDQVEQSRTLLEDALPLIRDACMPDAFAVAHITLAKILFLNNDGVDAEWILREAERIASGSGLSRVVRLIKWERVRQMLGRDDLDDARELADLLRAEGGPHRGAYVFHAEEIDGPQVGELRLLLHEGKIAEALRMIAAMNAQATFARRPLRRIRLRMLEAVALDRNGDAARAVRVATEVLQRTVPEQLGRLVLEETIFTALLERQLNRTASGTSGPLLQLGDLYQQLLSDKAPAPASAADINAILDKLTEREIGVLRMLTAGASNRDIGANLFVSENTVKYHLRNIYSKLGVKNRTEASNLALRSGLTK